MKAFECQMITEADLIDRFISRDRMQVGTVESGLRVTTRLD